MPSPWPITKKQLILRLATVSSSWVFATDINTQSEIRFSNGWIELVSKVTKSSCFRISVALIKFLVLLMVTHSCLRLKVYSDTSGEDATQVHLCVQCTDCNALSAFSMNWIIGHWSQRVRDYCAISDIRSASQDGGRFSRCVDLVLLCLSVYAGKSYLVLRSRNIWLTSWLLKILLEHHPDENWKLWIFDLTHDAALYKDFCRNIEFHAP